jgi:hypothetical protein
MAHQLMGLREMCINYRSTNKVTTKHTYSLPRNDDLLKNLVGAKYFSSIDLASCCHQFWVHEFNVLKTAFNTHFGKFDWCVLPMGRSRNTPALFQSVMSRLFGAMLN